MCKGGNARQNASGCFRYLLRTLLSAAPVPAWLAPGKSIKTKIRRCKQERDNLVTVTQKG